MSLIPGGAAGYCDIFLIIVTCEICNFLSYKGDQHSVPYPDTRTALPAARDLGPPRPRWVCVPLHPHERNTCKYFHLQPGCKTSVQGCCCERTTTPSDPRLNIRLRLGHAVGTPTEALLQGCFTWKSNWHSRPAVYG